MPDNNLPVHKIEEGIKRLRIQEDGKEDVTGPTGYPDHPGEPDCVYYLRTGMCGYGDTCRYNHPTYNGQDNNKYLYDLPERFGEPDCVYFLKTGTCKYGSTCKYNHPQDRRGADPIVLNMIGLPMRMGEKPCSHYVRTGMCKYGVSCKFDHPQPTVNWSNEPYFGPLSYAPPWPYPSPQTYMPIVLPSSSTTQGWNPYIGNMSQVLSTNALTSVDHVNPSTPTAQLPERLGEPECRYFMYTGTCKYGSDCKYHHPREKMVQSYASSLSPFGLPLRPGQSVCSYYSLYGICKYGPDCKYDHPLMVFPYDYNPGLTSLPTVNPFFLSYGKMDSPTVHSSESSTSNGKLCTDDSSTEHVGSSSNSPSQNQSD